MLVPDRAMATSDAGGASMATHRGKRRTWNLESSERRMKNLSWRWRGRRRRCLPLVSCAAAPWFPIKNSGMRTGRAARNLVVAAAARRTAGMGAPPSCRANGERNEREERTDFDCWRLRVSGIGRNQVFEAFHLKRHRISFSLVEVGHISLRRYVQLYRDL